MGTIDKLIFKWFDNNFNVMIVEMDDIPYKIEIGEYIAINPIESRIRIPRQEMSMVKTMFSLSFDEFCKFLMKWLEKKEIKIEGFNYLFILS